MTVKLGNVLAQGQQVGRRGLVVLLGLVKVALKARLRISTGLSNLSLVPNTADAIEGR